MPPPTPPQERVLAQVRAYAARYGHDPAPAHLAHDVSFLTAATPRSGCRDCFALASPAPISVSWLPTLAPSRRHPASLTYQHGARVNTTLAAPAGASLNGASASTIRADPSYGAVCSCRSSRAVHGCSTHRANDPVPRASTLPGALPPGVAFDD